MSTSCAHAYKLLAANGPQGRQSRARKRLGVTKLAQIDHRAVPKWRLEGGRCLSVPLVYHASQTGPNQWSETCSARWMLTRRQLCIWNAEVQRISECLLRRAVNVCVGRSLMSFTRSTLTTLFPVSRTAPSATAAEPTPLTSGPLEFLVPWESIHSGLWESLKAVSQRTRLPSAESAIFREGVVAKVELNRSRLFLSFLLHCLLVLTVRDLDMIFPASAGRRSPNYIRQEIVYRRLAISPTEMLPRAVRGGLAEKARSGSKSERPLAGGIAFAGRLTVVSRPRHPDNSRQNIRQLDSPPDLKITEEMKLPDTVFGNLQGPKRPLLHLEVEDVRPLPGKHPLAEELEPALSFAGPEPAPTILAEPATHHPQLPVGALQARRPLLKSGTGNPAVALPDDVGLPGTGSELVALSANPGWSTSEPALPPGNREGEFAVSPSGRENGRLGRTTDAVVDRSSEGNGGNGRSTATGPGKGDGNAAESASLAISGTRGPGESVGMLRSNLIASMVYPVKSALLPPKSQLVVSAGPMGGGGLNVYGTLQCGRIYTVFLEMPRKNWTLQFCEHREREEKNITKQNRSAVVHLAEGLTPPYAETKFDFRRLPVPEKDSQKLIVLKGILEVDGTVDKLEIYRGVVSEMDDAARLALSRWRFRPATRAKVPVAVDVLIGIPAFIPESHDPKQR